MDDLKLILKEVTIELARYSTLLNNLRNVIHSDDLMQRYERLLDVQTRLYDMLEAHHLIAPEDTLPF